MRYIFTCLMGLFVFATGFAQETVQAEYFIGEDPGYGKGTPIELNQEGNSYLSEFTADLTGLQRGIHILQLRAKDNQGIWSHNAYYSFYIFDKDDDKSLFPVASRIVEVEYYVDEDPGPGNGQKWDIDPADTLEANRIAVLGELPLGQHTLYVRAKDNLGKWSQVASYEFNVCKELPPEAGFDYIQNGYSVTLIDTSAYASEYYYTFGDGEEDSVSAPRYTYTNPGQYEVCQTVTNSCETSTICQTINISGITSYAPKAGGNTGDVSLTVEGAGLTENILLTLQKEETVIEGDTIIASLDGSTMTTVFNLRGVAEGSYDVVAVLNEGDTVRFADGFQVEAGQEAEPWVNIIGSNVIRRGRFVTYSIQCGNSGNTNAYGIPIWLAFVGDTTNIEVELDFDIVPPPDDTGGQDIAYDSLGLYIDVDSLISEPLPKLYRGDGDAFSRGRMSNGEVKAGRVYPLYIPIIPANSQFTIDFKVKANSEIEITAWTTTSLYEDRNGVNGRLHSSITDQVNRCVGETMYQAVNEELKSLIPGYDCYSSIANGIWAPQKYLIESRGNDLIGVVGSIAWGMAKGAVSCATSFIPASTVGKLVWAGIKVAATIEAGYNTGYSAGQACFSTFPEEKKKQRVSKKIRVVNSFDPNKKTGYVSASGSRYFNEQKPFTYTIYFENVDTASAAAQEVFIKDTLDTKVFDLSTLSLGHLSFGDTSVQAPLGAQAYSVDIDLRPEMNLIVRANAKLDTATGVISWYFGSLDPQTRELTEDPFAGFLPPNVNKGEGEGSVSFTIELKENLPHGTVVQNQAEIVFDLNKLIVTPIWTNIKDTEQPISAMIGGTLEVSDTAQTEINWSGNDADAGVMLYDVYVSEDEDEYILWYDQTDRTSSPFVGRSGSTYDFYTVAYDSVYNQESKLVSSELRITVNETITGLDELVDDALRVYPNPSSEKVIIEFKGHQSLKNKVIELIDLQGRFITTVPTSRPSVELITAHLQKGIYVLRITIDDQVYHHKILLE